MTQPVHLLVLIHGMWGNPSHLAEMDRIIREAHSKPGDDGVELKVLLAETNAEDSTYDGIDWGGERVAEEILGEVEKLSKDGKKVIRFSATGYSLGGLVARYVIGILHQRDFFADITPVNFNTVATPHIGVPKYPSMISNIFSSIGPRFLSRTGEQFFCVDKWSPNGRPLIEVMADPNRIFFQALAQFQHIRIYANALNDVTVPYVTAAIEVEDPFLRYKTNGLEVELDEEYSPLIKSYVLPAVPPPPAPKPVVMSGKWFQSLKPDQPLLPPQLQPKFPLNIVLYASLPLLIPTAITYALVRLSLESRSSRARVRTLEADASNSDKLIHILGKLEKQVEGTVVDMFDDSSTTVDAEDDKPAPAIGEIFLTPLQKRIAASLNTLPGLKKERAFIPRVRNSHAIIVCRDVKRVENDKMGEGIVRHWAHSFML